MKKSILLAIVSILALSSPAAAQSRSSAQLQPPQPNYSQYGSYSRQLQVYRNAQAQLDADARRRYRLFREEVRRQTARDRAVQPRIVVQRGNYQSGDALRLWRSRRDRQVVETRTRVVVRRTR